MKEQLCSGSDCFKEMDLEDAPVLADSSYHPLALRCWDCQTLSNRKALKAYRKRQRHKANTKTPPQQG